MSLNKLEPIMGFEDKEGLDLKLLRLLSVKLAEVFQSYGLSEIETPVIEQCCTFGRIDSDPKRNSEMFIFDVRNYRDGVESESLKSVLRPEGTAPTCRFYAKKRLQGNLELPFNVFYISPMFRNEDLSKTNGRTKRMFYQSGVELIGPSSTFADALVCDIAIKSLKSVGLEGGLQCRISDIRLFEGVVEECVRHLEPLNKANGNEHTMINDSGSELTFTKAIKKVIDGISTSRIKKDLVGVSEEYRRLKNIIHQTTLPDGLVQDLYLLSNTTEDESVLKGLYHSLNTSSNPKVKQALDNLAKLSRYLKQMNVPHLIDLGVVRGLDIYSGGMVMQIDANLDGKVEAEVGGGGRYNSLIKKILEESLGERGVTVPATGFAFGLDRLANVIKENGLVSEPSKVTLYADKKPADIIVHSDDPIVAYKKAEELRIGGKRVEMDLMKRSELQLLDYSNRWGIKIVRV